MPIEREVHRTNRVPQTLLSLRHQKHQPVQLMIAFPFVLSDLFHELGEATKLAASIEVIGGVFGPFSHCL